MYLKLPLLSLLLLASGALCAQTDSPNTARGGNFPEIQFGSPHNYLKLSLTGLIFKNYAVQYEHVLNRKFSLALGLRYMPPSALPFKNYFKKYAGDDERAIKILNETEFSNFAITPELRLYLGKKGFGRGMYLAPFYRYASFRSDLVVFYDDDEGNEQNVTYNGTLKSHTGGLLIGAQFPVGKHLCIDWQILGAHIGTGNGFFESTYSEPMSDSNQKLLREALESIDLPLTEKTVEAEPNRSSLKLDGPWGGLRASLSIGVKF